MEGKTHVPVFGGGESGKDCYGLYVPDPREMEPFTDSQGRNILIILGIK